MSVVLQMEKLPCFCLLFIKGRLSASALMLSILEQSILAVLAVVQ